MNESKRAKTVLKTLNKIYPQINVPLKSVSTVKIFYKKICLTRVYNNTNKVLTLLYLRLVLFHIRRPNFNAFEAAKLQMDLSLVIT